MSSQEGFTGAGDDFEEVPVDVAAVASRLGMSIATAPTADDGDAEERPYLRYAGRSMVLEDGVLKERVNNEKKARKIWERRWGLLALREKMFREEMAKLGIDPRPPSLRPCPAPLPVTNVLPSPTIPKLSSGFVGWRSTQPEMTLEMFGPFYKSPRHTIEPAPDKDDLPRNKQYFIRLG